MIYLHSNETQTAWDRGKYKVRLDVPTNSQPIAFCDGTEEDVAELRARAESEGADGFRIERKTLKTGREIWTLHTGE